MPAEIQGMFNLQLEVRLKMHATPFRVLQGKALQAFGKQWA